MAKDIVKTQPTAGYIKYTREGKSSAWNFPPYCNRDVEEFMNQAKQYAQLVIPNGLIINPPDFEGVENGIITVFVIKYQTKLSRQVRIML